MTNNDIINKILEDEGGYVNHPNDKGGPTNFGITLQTLSEWRHQEQTEDDVKNLSKEEAIIILYQKYLTAPGFIAIPYWDLKYLVVDMWVNHGPKNATLIIQRALGLPGDGIMGKHTLQSIVEQATVDTFRKVLAERIRFYGRIIKKNPDQAVFAAGWMDRVADFLWEN